jgi:hypothetical protein
VKGRVDMGDLRVFARGCFLPLDFVVVVVVAVVSLYTVFYARIIDKKLHEIYLRPRSNSSQQWYTCCSVQTVHFCPGLSTPFNCENPSASSNFCPCPCLPVHPRRHLRRHRRRHRRCQDRRGTPSHRATPQIRPNQRRTCDSDTCARARSA